MPAPVLRLRLGHKRPPVPSAPPAPPPRRLPVSKGPSLPRPSSLCPAGKITLRDLKQCKLASVFFDTFFNIEKYLGHEQKEQASLLRVSGPPAPPP